MLRITCSLALSLLSVGLLTGCGNGTADAAPRSHTGASYGFRVEIGGAASTAPWTSVEGISHSMVWSTESDPATGRETSRPGPGVPVNVTLSGEFVPGMYEDIRTWVKDTYDGKDIRKDITIECFDQAGDTVRTFNLIDCFPTSFRIVGLDEPHGNTAVKWTLEVRVNRIDMA